MSRTRQLAAIMFTDIVGYTSLMGEDEDRAFELLKKNREIQRPIIEKYNGRWLKEMGDGVLASFPTITDAVYAAATIQKICELESDLKLRIGIHQGEVVFDGEDVFGNGVNIASRLEPLAPVGGIIVSDSIYKNVNNKKGITTNLIGEKQLKGVNEPVTVYQLAIPNIQVPVSKLLDGNRNQPKTLETAPSGNHRFKLWIGAIVILVALSYVLFPYIFNQQSISVAVPEINEKSIAVLPFRDISPNKDQEWFSDGILEAILDHITKIPGLKVTSRTSVMKFRNSDKSIPEIAEELGVNFLLEGGVQVYGDQVRITAQLIDPDDQHLWSEQYDQPYEDIFTIQSEVAESIASVIEVSIGPEVKELILKVPTNNMEAYNYLLKASVTDDIWGEKWKLLEQAIELDPEFAEAYAKYGDAWYSQYTWASVDTLTNAQIMDKSLELINKALDLDPNLASAHKNLGDLYCYGLLDLKAADKEYQIAQTLRPSDPHMTNPEFLMAVGRHQEAFATVQRQIESDPLNYFLYGTHVMALYFNEQIEEALLSAENYLKKTNFGGNTVYGVSRVLLWVGKYEKVIQLYEQDPSFFARAKANAAIAYLKIDQQDKAAEIIESLKSRKTGLGSPAYCLGLIYAQMGAIDTAFEWLEKAYEERQGELYWLKEEPPFQPLHSDPRWQIMLEKVGFP